MMEERELTCICCPMGCTITANVQGTEVIRVTGNTCRRGEVYARKELTDPTRIVTSTVRVRGRREVVSVKTQSDIPKDKMMECVRELKNVCVEAPVHIGQIIVPDIAGTKVAVVATKEIE